MKRRRLFTISIHLLVILACGTAFYFLLKQEGMLPHRGEPQTFSRLIPGDLDFESWRSIYMDDQWIGFSTVRYGTVEEGFLLQSSSLIRFTFFTQIQELAIETTQRLDRDHRLDHFTMTLSGLADATITGHRKGNRMVAEAVYGGMQMRKTFDMAEDLFLDQSILQVYRGDDLEPGDTYRLNILNPMTLQAEEAVLTVTGREGDYLTMETRFAGLVSTSWIDEQGMVVREETPTGWLVKAESRAEVERRREGSRFAAVDILEQTAIPLSRRIASPRSVEKMTVRITGYDPELIPTGDNGQTFLDRHEGILRIEKQMPETISKSLSQAYGQDLQKYLEPSLWIDSDDPSILARSRTIVGDESDPWRAAQLIGDWVYRSIEKSPSPGIPIATQVLRERRGDCNEHTSLFVALARAAGIPTKMSAGLVYLDGSFYYHAWPKVFLGTWVHMDPTFGQHMADATHIELVSGDFAAQGQIVMALGRIGIEIIDYR